MGAIVLACGRGAAAAGSPALSGRPGIAVRTAPARPDKEHVDPVLAELDPAGHDDRLVVLGDDADLAAVVLRLLRTDRLAEIPIGFVPVSTESEVAVTWDLPTDQGRALDVALNADADRVPLIRDDNGGVLVGLGRIGPLRGVAYCDDARVLRGPARVIRVSPHAADGGGLEVFVAPRGLLNRRSKVTHGRAFELGCLPTKVIKDGVPHDRPIKRWNWYRHTEDLRLIRGLH